MALPKRLFGKTSNGDEVYSYTLSNQNGCSVEILTLGGIIHSFLVPDASGKVADVVTGLETVQDYERNPAYFGAVIGRVTNRLRSKFKIDGEEFHLNCNVGNVCQHGGVSGFDKKLWEHQSGSSEEGQWVELTYTSANGEEGFPGVLDAKVVYTLDQKSNKLVMDMQAKCSSTTIINLTNHAYFNLNGHESNSLKGHNLKVYADHYLPLDNHYLPTGEVRRVEGSIFDMREEVKLEEVVEQIEDGAGVRGIDHNFCINDYKDGASINKAVVLKTSDIVLTLQTNQPGVQVYTGNHLDGSIRGKGGVVYHRHSCVALEPQKWPDAANQPHFPSILLRPNDTYQHTSTYTFSH